MANAFAENLGSFDDFKRAYGVKKPALAKKSVSEPKLNIDNELKKAQKILSGFTPPAKGGT